MPMFPSRRTYAPQQATNVMPVQDQYDPLQQGQTRQRRGLFGGRARGVLRREDGDPGTLANYFLFGREGVQGMRDSRMQRDIFNSQMRSQKIEEGAAESQRAALEAAIAQLPVDQQAWARLNPEAFVERMLNPDNGWESGQGYSHAFRVNPDGTVTRGDPLPIRPRAPSSAGGVTEVPDGFVLD